MITIAGTKTVKPMALGTKLIELGRDYRMNWFIKLTEWMHVHNGQEDFTYMIPESIFLIIKFIWYKMIKLSLNILYLWTPCRQTELVKECSLLVCFLQTNWVRIKHIWYFWKNILRQVHEMRKAPFSSTIHRL